MFDKIANFINAAIELISYIHIILGFTLALGLIGAGIASVLNEKYWIATIISALGLGFVLGLLVANNARKDKGAANFMSKNNRFSK